MPECRRSRYGDPGNASFGCTVRLDNHAVHALIVPPSCLGVIRTLTSGPHHHDHHPPCSVSVQILQDPPTLGGGPLLAQCRDFCALIY